MVQSLYIYFILFLQKVKHMRDRACVAETFYFQLTVHIFSHGYSQLSMIKLRFVRYQLLFE